ncbi:DUF397 domain-containing protein [Streptomyces bobili]|uniref:DUF397 domain-containing protein n=1 Tax=Streptomyces bobili TaxID=67280 RepID=UPI0033A53D20
MERGQPGEFLVAEGLDFAAERAHDELTEGHAQVHAPDADADHERAVLGTMEADAVVALLAPLTWQKSSFSGGGEGNACLEDAASAKTLQLRASDEPAITLTTTPPGLQALIHSLRPEA